MLKISVDDLKWSLPSHVYNQQRTGTPKLETQRSTLSILICQKREKKDKLCLGKIYYVIPVSLFDEIDTNENEKKKYFNSIAKKILIVICLILNELASFFFFLHSN